ncbi:ribbon-helix-helix domain-containing protein [Candidatus Micrarchaeota archaeon]|nr:ribbon-helix-helix domain-containing protein [Candidatus Micrarchaeota archaeon]
MKMLTVEMDERFVEVIDRLIKSSGMYSSRSEFLKDSIRKNYEELIKHDKDLLKIHQAGKELAETARKRGAKGGLLSKKEKDEIAREYMKEKAHLIKF